MARATFVEANFLCRRWTLIKIKSALEQSVPKFYRKFFSKIGIRNFHDNIDFHYRNFIRDIYLLSRNLFRTKRNENRDHVRRH